LENDVYNCVNKFSSKIPKGFVRKPMGQGSTYTYHDAGGFAPFSQADVDDYIDSMPPRLEMRFVYYQRNDVAAPSGLMVGQYNISRDDVERLQDSNRAESLAFLRRNPSCALLFFAIRPLEEYDVAESYRLQKGTDAVYYNREKGAASWIRYEVSDNVSGAFPLDREQLQGGKIVRAEQVQRYIDLAERFYKTYSPPKGEPD
jgi:hypothetical protein